MIHAKALRLLLLLSLLAPVASALDTPNLPSVEEFAAAFTSAEAGARMRAIGLAPRYGAAGIEALAGHLFAEDLNTATSARRGMGAIVYESRDHVGVANALLRVTAAMVEGGLAEPRRREAVLQLLEWTAAVAAPEHVPALEAFLKVPELDQAAATVIHAIPGERATEALVAVLRQPENKPFRKHVARLLGTRTGPQVVRTLIGAAGEQPSELGWACVDALARHGAPPNAAFPLTASATQAETVHYTRAAILAGQVLAEQGKTAEAEGILKGFTGAGAAGYQVREALLALSLAGSEAAPELALGHLAHPQVREAAIEALSEARGPDVDERLTKAFHAVPPAARTAILEAMARRGGGVLEQFLAENTLEEDAALRYCVARLTKAEPRQEDLLELAEHGPVWVRFEAATACLRRGTDLLRAGESEAAAVLFGKLLAPGFPASRRMAALEGLLHTGRTGDLPKADILLRDAATEELAWALMLQALLAWPDQDDARKALTRIAPMAEGPVADQVRDALAYLGTSAPEVAAREGWVTRWNALGPFPNVDGAAFGKSYYPPRRKRLGPIIYNGARLGWETMKTEGLPARAALGERFGEEPAAVYLHATVAAPEDLAAVLELHGAGGFEVWVNGEQCAAGPEAPKEGVLKAPVQLSAGVNTVLVKSLHGEGPWDVAVRVTTPEGAPVDLGPWRGRAEAPATPSSPPETSPAPPG